MTNTSGDSALRIFLDSDAIIASILEDDSLHSKSLEGFAALAKTGTDFYITATTVAEIVVGLHRKFNQRSKALTFLEKAVSEWVKIVAVDRELLNQARRILASSQSKKNTIFDAINVAAVKKYQLDAIFSFDKWYKTRGIKAIPTA